MPRLPPPPPLPPSARAPRAHCSRCLCVHAASLVCCIASSPPQHAAVEVEVNSSVTLTLTPSRGLGVDLDLGVGRPATRYDALAATLHAMGSGRKVLQRGWLGLALDAAAEFERKWAALDNGVLWVYK